MAPISLHLEDKGVNPVHTHSYTVPISVEQQHTEIARLIDIDVLGGNYSSEWACTKFTIAKK